MRKRVVIIPFVLLIIVLALAYETGSKHEADNTPALRINKAGICLIDNKVRPDSAMENIIAVYRDSIEYIMKERLCDAAQTLYAERPEGPLNRFLADVMLTEVQEFATLHNKPRPEMSLVNVGGIRDVMHTGTITVGDAYTISPFENAPVVLALDSATVMAMAHQMAKRGGEAVSGISMTISNGEASNVKVGGQSLTSSRLYRLATLDYIATGGDGFSCLIDKEEYSTGSVFRNFLIHYLRRLGQNGIMADDPGNERVKSLDVTPEENPSTVNER